MNGKQKVLLYLGIFCLVMTAVVSKPLFVSAQTVTPSPSPTPSGTPAPTPDSSNSSGNASQISDLQAKINDLQNKIGDLQGQEKTLSSQIAVMDSQQKLTEYKIAVTKQQILSIEEDIDTTKKKIANLESSLSNLTAVLMNRIVANYEVGNQAGLQTLLISNDFSDYLKRASYLKLIENHDQHLLYDTIQAKSDYANQKQIFEDKRKKVIALQADLVSYTKQLEDEKVAKQDLLKETEGSEANYQRQLAQFKAELSSLSNFATSRAGSGGSIIPHADQSDSWGKYFNQRDASWGNMHIGLSSEQVWVVGCLMTSYAMVSSHYGNNVTPADVAANSDNFSLGTAYFKLPGPAAGGHGPDYQANPSITHLREIVASGTPVIAGLSVNGGPYPQRYSDHWVVLRGVNSDGSFQINDPWYAGAMNVNLNDHYSGWTIIEARIYQ